MTYVLLYNLMCHFVKIFELSAIATANGCSSSKNATGKIITCRQERRFFKPQRLYAAANNCRAQGLIFRYRFEVFDYEPSDSCSRATPTTTRRATVGVQTAATAAAVLASLARLSAIFGSGIQL